jgi:hypothetical protein
METLEGHSFRPREHRHPVEVRIENQSGRPLRIEYDHFVLEGASRFQYAALSPFELREEGLAMGGSGRSPATWR